MKWNTLIGSLVLGLGICTQSFGFELLDRMLGVSSCCESGCAKKSCCEAAAPSCCAAAEPTCAAAGPTCAAAEPTCAAAPSCGCERAAGCCKQKCCRQPLFNFNRCCKPKCGSACGGNGCCGAAAPTCAAAEPTCAVAEPTCAAAPACGNSCCKSRCCGSLLDRIFVCNKRCCKPKCCKSACGCNGGCAAAAPTCGCEGGHAAPAPAMEGGDMPPMPPAPVVDPSAFVPSQRRVVHASAGSLR